MPISHDASSQARTVMTLCGRDYRDSTRIQVSSQDRPVVRASVYFSREYASPTNVFSHLARKLAACERVVSW